MADRTSLLADLDAAHADFHDALADVDLALADVPGVMDDWSVRDIVFHLAAWCEHGSAALDLATAGRGDEFAYARDETDAMNVDLQAEGRAVSPADALAREEAAFDGFRRRIAALDSSLVGLRLGNGDTVEEVIAYDGAEHYEEHTEPLRAWFGTDEDGGA